MELDPDYTFVPLAPRHYMEIENKDTQHYFGKWGLQGNISIQDFCFNEPFQPYNKYHLAERFFKDQTVANHLLLKEGDSWIAKGIKASSIEVTAVPCFVLNMSFFDKLLDPANKIVHNSGVTCKRFDTDIEGFTVSDNLRGMILDEYCEEYQLFNSEERAEFIFRIFEMLVLGGSLCQFEEELQPYLDTTKKIYKELVRVQKRRQQEQQGANRDLSIGTTVLQVVAKNERGEAFYPANPEHRQNIGFLLIDGSNRQITTLLHQFGSFHW
ncbi:cilia- and flagella-associated protein 300-like isoform X1 [Nasonia vitripennis]|uniref:Cilia- and flagella-associated protein 300 n=1 Tax=Nasonia vitripennis TaxID=7425 RepID=A0A7M7H778_NASVI|nr:cilia- and flagella-associated protein 300-like isoform X1 [Nasonia vitripennis]